MLRVENSLSEPSFTAGEVVELKGDPNLVIVVDSNVPSENHLFSGILVSCPEDHHMRGKQLPYFYDRWTKTSFKKSTKIVTFEN